MAVEGLFVREFDEAQVNALKLAIDNYVAALRQKRPVGRWEADRVAAHIGRLYSIRFRIGDTVSLTWPELIDLTNAVCGQPLLGYGGCGSYDLRMAMELREWRRYLGVDPGCADHCAANAPAL